MPTSFLDLPREIRDIIYNDTLLSPTGYIEPVAISRSEKPPSTNAITSPCPRFSLRVVTDKGTSPIDPQKHAEGNISLSLLRTCRQVHCETQSLFWENNTFSFNNAHQMSQALKAMGQIASRLITSISFNLSLADYKTLPKALRLLESRARHGGFRKLQLDVQNPAFLYMMDCKNGAMALPSSVYDSILGSLRQMECKFERRLNVETPKRTLVEAKYFYHDTLRELALAFGGRMYWNGALEWNDYKHVGLLGGSMGRFG